MELLSNIEVNAVIKWKNDSSELIAIIEIRENRLGQIQLSESPFVVLLTDLQIKAIWVL